MHHLSIDYLIIGAFFLITLIIGLRAGRSIKDIREYAIANKMFGTGALVLTWLATDVAGETVLRTIDGYSSLAKQKQIAEETMAFFVPLAKRLGLHEAAQELEERSREVLMKGTH